MGKKPTLNWSQAPIKVSITTELSSVDFVFIPLDRFGAWWRLHLRYPHPTQLLISSSQPSREVTPSSALPLDPHLFVKPTDDFAKHTGRDAHVPAGTRYQKDFIPLYLLLPQCCCRHWSSLLRPAPPANTQLTFYMVCWDKKFPNVQPMFLAGFNGYAVD